MPFAIHEEAFKKQMTVNVMRPQEEVPGVLPQNFSGTMSQGVPVKRIPHLEFPRVVYLHPAEPNRIIEHRNANFEVVGTEVMPAEHLTKSVQNAAELEQALDEGYVKEPYIPKPPADPNAKLYHRKRKAS